MFIGGVKLVYQGSEDVSFLALTGAKIGPSMGEGVQTFSPIWAFYISTKRDGGPWAPLSEVPVCYTVLV